MGAIAAGVAGREVGRCLVGSCLSDGTSEETPKHLTGRSGVGTESQVYSIQIRWMEYFLLLNFIHLYFSFMNE